MGIRKRLVWLIIGLILCQMCGCGKETSGEVLSEPTVAVSDYMWVQDEMAVSTPKVTPMIEAESEQTVTPTLIQEQVSVAEVLQEQVGVTETPQEPAAVTEEPRESVAVTEIPREPVAVTEVPQESVAVIEPPQESVVVTEAPGKAVVATEAPLEHVHSAQTALEEATCLGAGVRKEYCTICNEVLHTEKVNALGHDFTKSVWELPTCQKSGYYNNVCNRCGLVECVTQEPLPHEVEDITLQEGNCMEDTVIQHVCRVCGVQVKEDTRYTRSDVHTWKTESIDGEEIVYCEWCGVAQ